MNANDLPCRLCAHAQPYLIGIGPREVWRCEKKRETQARCTELREQAGLTGNCPVFMDASGAEP